MTKYKFIEIPELIDYIFEHQDHEVGFTGDVLEDIEMYGEPTGWNGVKIDTSFDGLSLMVGYYGNGITQSWNLDDFDGDKKREVERLFTNWFRDWFFHIGPICVDAKDLKGDAL